MSQISLPRIIKQNESKNNACLAGVSCLGMKDPPIERPTSKGQQNIVQHKIVAITTNLFFFFFFFLLLLLLLLNKLKVELRQIGFRLQAVSGVEPSSYSVKVTQLSLLLLLLLLSSSSSSLSSNDCCYVGNQDFFEHVQNRNCCHPVSQQQQSI